MRFIYTFIFIVLILLTTACEKLVQVPFIALRAEFAPSASIAQLGQAITFNQLSSQVAQKFEWNFGDNTQSTDANPTHTYQKIGRYKVKMTATKADGITKETREREVLILPPTTALSTSLKFGTETADEFGFSFSRLLDGFILVGRESLNTLYIVRSNGDFENFSVIWEMRLSNLGRGKITGKDVKPTSDGGFVIVGDFEYNEGKDKDSFILKLAENGTEEWRVVNATARLEEYNSVVQIENLFVVAGTVASENIDNSRPRITVDIYNANNGVLEGSFADGNNWQTNDIVFTNDGFALAVTEGDKPSLIRYNASFLQPKKTTLPFSGRGLGITQLQDGSFVLVGSVAQSGDSTNAFISRIDNFGTRLWTKTLVYYHDIYYSVAQDANNDIVVLGTHYNPLSQKDVLLSKYNLQGELKASRLLGGSKDDEAFKMEIIPQTNNIFVLGTSQSFNTTNSRDFYFLKVNSDNDLK
jgi:PKD repeat protein